MSRLKNAWSALTQNHPPKTHRLILERIPKTARPALPTDQKDNQFPAGIGVLHPYKFAELERWYIDDPYVHGMIEKHVDFILGGGFYAKSRDKTNEELIQQQMRNLEFQTLLRNWVRRALIHNGYLYITYDQKGAPANITILDGKYVYIRLKKRSDGKLINDIEGYTQFIDLQTTPEGIKIEEQNVAHLAFNKIGDNPYGIGIIQPLTFTLGKKVKFIQDMCRIMSNKAAAKTIIKVGNPEVGYIPEDTEVQAFGVRLESMTNDTEWVVGPHTEFSVLNYGDPGKNFTAPMELINQELTFGSQVPEVLMGKGNIPEGLAKEQMKSWLFRIRSLQEEIEKVVEQKIFAPLLIANGKNPKDIEFEWGSPTPEEQRANIEMYKGLLQLGNPMSPVIGEPLRAEVEKKVYEQLEIKPPTDVMEQPLPAVPPEQLKRDKERSTEEAFFRKLTEEVDDDKLNVPLKEFVGFNYLEFIEFIKKFIDSKEFEERTYETFQFIPGTEQQKWESFVSNYKLTDTLSKPQVNTLRDVLKTGFDEGKRLIDIRKDILEQVRPAALKIELPNGRKLELNPEIRSTIIARTETVRATNQGLLEQMKENNIAQAQWITSPGERTCSYCIGQNGKILTLNEARERIPAHVSCRCAWAPVK